MSVFFFSYCPEIFMVYLLQWNTTDSGSTRSYLGLCCFEDNLGRLLRDGIRRICCFKHYHAILSRNWKPETGYYVNSSFCKSYLFVLIPHVELRAGMLQPYWGEFWCGTFQLLGCSGLFMSDFQRVFYFGESFLFVSIPHFELRAGMLPPYCREFWWVALFCTTLVTYSNFWDGLAYSCLISRECFPFVGDADSLLEPQSEPSQVISQSLFNIMLQRMAATHCSQ